MAKQIPPVTVSKILTTMLIGLAIYVAGGFALVTASFATGGFTLFGVEARGLGAAVNIILQTWIYLFPIVFVFIIIRNHEEAKLKALKNKKKR